MSSYKILHFGLTKNQPLLGSLIRAALHRDLGGKPRTSGERGCESWAFSVSHKTGAVRIIHSYGPSISQHSRTSPDMISVAAIAIYVVLELVESFEGVRACDASEIPHLLRLDLDLDIAERVSQTLDTELGTISWEEIVTIIGLIARLEDFHTDFEDFHTEFEASQ